MQQFLGHDQKRRLRLCPLLKGIGPRNRDRDRAHMANHRAGGGSVEAVRDPTSGGEGNSHKEKRSRWGKGAKEM